jgi:MFS family permease
MGIFPTANNVSSALYPLAGGVIGEIFDWRATFALTAILAVVGGLMLVPLLLRVDLAPPAGGARPARADPRILHGRQRVVAIGAITAGVVATLVHRHGFRSTVLPLYAATALGLGGISIATAIGLMSITAIAVSIPGGILRDRIGRRRVIMAGLTVFALGDLGFLLTNDLLSFVVVAAVVGLGDFFPSSQTALLSEIVPPEQRTRVLSGYRFAVDLGAFIGPILLAAVMDVAGAQAAIVLTAAIILAAVLAARFGIPAGVERRAAAHGAPTA